MKNVHRNLQRLIITVILAVIVFLAAPSVQQNILYLYAYSFLFIICNNYESK